MARYHSVGLGNAFYQNRLAGSYHARALGFGAQALATRAGVQFKRRASLSAIHAGRRRENRVKSSSGSRTPNWGTPERKPRLERPNYAERREAREAAAKSTVRIIKGKKDITWKDGPKSRRARFYDPDDSFGKKSLVYQAKSGQLQEQMKELGARDTNSKDTGSRDTRPGGFSWDKLMAESARQDPGKKPPRDRGRSRERSGIQRDGLGREQRHRGRGPDQERRNWGRESNPERQGRGRGPGQEGRNWGRGRNPERQDRGRGPGRERQDREERHDREERLAHKPDTYRPQLSIPYTTAASQFLYGRSTVKAALQSSRRRLYVLYIYGGPNRQNLSQDLAIRNLAERKGVDVKMVGEHDLRLLDKLSAGRPHNGYVLEASPLPQLPLLGLGSVSEDVGKPGFYVQLAHQSAEEAEINGTANFIPLPPGSHKPLVIVLDQILDPGNLGAILRTVSFLGASAVAITKSNSSSLTPVALKASSGASEELKLLTIDSLPKFLAESKESGWEIYAAAPATAKARHQRLDVHEIEDRDPLSKNPCILVLGSEGEGLANHVKGKADFEVGISNRSGSVILDSLNVSVAAGLLCSGFLKGKVKSEQSASRDKKEAVELW